MSSLRMKHRERRRELLSKKYKEKRLKLRKIINNINATLSEKETAQSAMQRLPKDSSFCRVNRRCRITGRSKGIYRFVGLSRAMFRLHAMRGDIPGIKKASW